MNHPIKTSTHLSVLLRLFSCIFLLALFTTTAWAKLPEEALKKAQQAEKLVQQSRVKDALVILQNLSREYPTEPALSLRLAQLFDGLGQPGAALFYYRQYADLAKDNPREEAVARTQTLELTAQARDGAAAFAKALKQTTKAMNTPAVNVETSMMKAAPDGTLTHLKPSDVGLSDDLAKNDPKPAPLPTAALAPVRTIEMPRASGTTETKSIRVFGEAASRAAPAFTPPPFTRPDPTATPPATPAPAAKVTAVPQAPEPSPKARRGELRVEVIDPGPGEQIAVGPASNPQGEAPSLSDLEIAMQPAGQTATGPLRATEKTPRPAALRDGVFTTRNVGGNRSALKITNKTPNSMLAVNAIPRAGGESINILLAHNETRTAEFLPGDYELVVTLNRHTYPPTKLIDRTFDYSFRPGVQYEKTFDDAGSQSGNL
ncbi:hypothetical protein CVU37_04970 [candidate division BRC1 bacterium HGW-BRC1-1]|nr:MAG: hypothetical protein CVU37_04970 [candidate division BRC1 bacterium HGW-BRC1-1]